jgi:ubiquinol-cytochrome c reductase cytochrome b subunit
VLALYPFIERRATGDTAFHHVLDRPRDAATRTGLGTAGIVFYGVLWAAAGNDVIADRFDVSLFATTWFFRVALLAGPPLAFAVTRRLCLGLQRRDLLLLEHGVETGIIVRSPSGGFGERTRPLPAEAAERLRARTAVPRPSGGPLARLFAGGELERSEEKEHRPVPR